MVIVLYLLIILSSVAQSSAAKLFNRRSSSSVIFNTVKSYTVLVLFCPDGRLRLNHVLALVCGMASVVLFKL